MGKNYRLFSAAYRLFSAVYRLFSAVKHARNPHEIYVLRGGDFSNRYINRYIKRRGKGPPLMVGPLIDKKKEKKLCARRRRWGNEN